MAATPTCWERLCCSKRGIPVATTDTEAHRVESVNLLESSAASLAGQPRMRPARMNHDFEGVEESEVSVSKNTIVQVVEEASDGQSAADGWSYVICPNGAAGYVPAAFFAYT